MILDLSTEELEVVIEDLKYCASIENDGGDIDAEQKRLEIIKSLKRQIGVNASAEDRYFRRK